MNKPTWFGKEPAALIGLIATIVLGIVSTLAGQGVISDAVSGKITDGVNAIVPLLTLFAPLIAGLLIRPVSTSVAQPSLPAGTTVNVITPKGLPDVTVILPTVDPVVPVAPVVAPVVPPAP